ncbi:uncharacterized protein VTP21DRAFT_8595 [Calcarisporiella thermophila]|uniref:uncharacterized protein n=1 Tax=Calcarisporiella thermophila TaxID=911321 RepID=UPI0037437499
MHRISHLLALIVICSLFNVFALAAPAKHMVGGDILRRDGGTASAKIITQCSVPGTFAITFDDGPHPTYTNQLLEFLKQKNLKATFFVNGQNYGNIRDNSAIVQRAFQDGHLIASHTWSHKDLTTLDENGIKTEMIQLEEALKDIIQVRPIYMRPPYGNVDDRVLGILDRMGYKVIKWDIDTNDFNENLESSKQAYQTKLQSLNAQDSGHISLQHDTHEITVRDLAPWAYEYIDKMHYKAVTVAECLGNSNPSTWYNRV